MTDPNTSPFLPDLCEPRKDNIYGWYVRTVEEFPISPGDIRCGYAPMFLTTDLELKHSTTHNNQDQFYFSNELIAQTAISDYVMLQAYPSINFNGLNLKDLFDEE
jgi:hypothetical protein